MMKFLKTSLVLLVSVGVLVACNTGEDNTDEEAPEQQNTSPNEDDNVNEDVEKPEDETDETDEDSLDQNESNDQNNSQSEGEIEDQMELGIGDKAVIQSSLGVYEVTLNSVNYEEEVDGVMSELDGFLLVNYTIENVGENSVKLMESINVLEATDELEGTGEGNVSGSYESVDSFNNDELESGDNVTKDVLYLAYDADQYYIRVVQGLIASGGVKNEILFSFNKSEIE